MLDHYASAVTLLQTEKTLFGKDHDVGITQATQEAHFIESLPGYKRDVKDSVAVMKKLQEDKTGAFTKEQRKAMGKAVSTHMHSITDSVVAGSKQGQSHPYLMHYMSEALWDSTEDDNSTTDDEKRNLFADFFMTMGLRSADTDLSLIHISEPTRPY